MDGVAYNIIADWNDIVKACCLVYDIHGVLFLACRPTDAIADLLARRKGLHNLHGLYHMQYPVLL